ncbi:MAG: hypothetical protein V4449_01455 [Patescibacteria group bacterium]
MEERVKTSFIPKAALKVERTEVRRASPVALVNIVAGAILVITILAAGGLFVFERYSVQAVESKRQSLERSRAAFEPATIKELSRLDTRIAAGTALLKSHTALSYLFDELEKQMLSSVRFEDFSYDIADPTRTLLSASGEAASFNAVALQSDAFSKSSIITEPIFSNVNISKTGTIIFDFTAVIDTSRMGYTGTVAPAVSVPSVATSSTPAL